MLTQLRDCDKHFSFVFKGQLFFFINVFEGFQDFCKNWEKDEGNDDEQWEILFWLAV